MKFEYNKENDVMLVELNKEKIDYAEQTGNLIVHFSPGRKAVLLEFLDASQFLKKAVSSIPTKFIPQLFPRSFATSIKRD